MKELYRPSRLKKFLEEKNCRAKKTLSQNFLIDQNIISKILEAAKVAPGDFIIEIGPGPGALTEALLNAGATVLAIEMDRTFAEGLHRLQTDDQRLTIIEADFLDLPLATLLQGKPKAKVISNLPYHITTPIIAKLFTVKAHLYSLTLMVQKEVALRFVASKKSPDYSSISLFLRYHSIPSYCFTVKPTCFYPRPSVHSAVVHLALTHEHSLNSEEAFFHLVRTAFCHRRKMLRAALKSLYCPSDIEQGLEALSLSPLSRPEDLSLEEFIALHDKLSSACK
jgi:16S rRNA (adenine1518-N6/adenine1519-N6)-dimethyltransferase